MLFQKIPILFTKKGLEFPRGVGGRGGGIVTPKRNLFDSQIKCLMQLSCPVFCLKQSSPPPHSIVLWCTFVSQTELSFHKAKL